MVTIINYKKRQKEDGSQFCVLELSGGIEFVKSDTTGQYYATIKRGFMPATFNEAECRRLVGTSLPGEINKVECEPYQYTVKGTGETVTLAHRFEYSPELEASTNTPAFAD